MTASPVWLITGATGFLGCALLDRLLSEQHERPGSVPALGVLVRPASRRARLDAVLERHPHANATVIVGTLDTPADAAVAVAGVELVFHLAASMSGRLAELFSTTVGATRNLLEAMSAAAPQARLLLVSSFGVYDSAGLPPGACIDENTPLEPRPSQRDAYSHAKLAQEELVRSWQRRHGLRVAIARPGVIYGPESHGISARVGLFLGPVFLNLGGRNLLPLTYVDNCADALFAIARSGSFTGEVYNVVDDELLDATAFLRRSQIGRRPKLVLRLPWPMVRGLAWGVSKAHRLSRGRFPLFMTPYRALATWRPQTYSNRRLHALGWQPRVGVDEALHTATTAAHSGG